MRVETLDGANIFVIQDFLPPEECARHIALSESSGYSSAPVTTAGGGVMRKDIRDNTRLIHEDPELAEALFRRARPLLPDTWPSGWELAGFNERFRFYRYDPGQRFTAHLDGHFERPSGERSQLTFMVYLNEDCEGGETIFHHVRSRLAVRPRTGHALVFNHRRLHEGAPVVSGRKYVLRTDVMYRRGGR